MERSGAYGIIGAWVGAGIGEGEELDAVEADLLAPVDEWDEIQKTCMVQSAFSVERKEGEADSVVGPFADFLPMRVCFHLRPTGFGGALWPLKMASRQLSAISIKAPRKPLSRSPLRMARGNFW